MTINNQIKAYNFYKKELRPLLRAIRKYNKFGGKDIRIPGTNVHSVLLIEQYYIYAFDENGCKSYNYKQRMHPLVAETLWKYRHAIMNNITENTNIQILS